MAGQEGKNGLLGSSAVRHPNARRVSGGDFDALDCAPGLWMRGDIFYLVAGPRRVHLKPKVHSSRLFEYSWKELSFVIFIKSLSIRISLKSLSLAQATRGYRTSVRNPLGGVPSKRTICVICF